jgi:hypothetical protein
MIKKLFPLLALLALLALLFPATVPAGSWDVSTIKSGGQATFTWTAADTGDQAKLDMIECGGDPTIFAEPTNNIPASIGLYLTRTEAAASTASTLAATVTTRGDYSSLKAGPYYLMPAITSAGAGGKLKVSCGSGEAIRVAAGGRWVAQTNLFPAYEHLIESKIGSESGVRFSSGHEAFFDDFNETFSYTYTANGTMPAASGGTAVAESSPSLTPTGSNVAIAPRWARSNVGSPTTINFFSRLLTGSSNELHSSAQLGTAAGDTSDGFFLMNPAISLGISIGPNTFGKAFGLTTRVSLAESPRQVGAFFFGAANALLGGDLPLTTAGVPSTVLDAHYFGFFIDDANNVKVVMNKSNVAQFLFDTGFNLSTTFTTLEMRGLLENDISGNWVAGYIDCFVNGIPVVPAAGRKHCIEPADLVWAPGSLPVHLTFGYVHTTGGNTLAYRLDYVGMMRERLVGQQ